MSLKAGPPRVSHPIERRRDHRRPTALDHQSLAPDPPYPPPRQRELAHEPREVALRLGRHRHDHARRSLSEEQEIGALGTGGQIDLGAYPTLPADTAFGQRDSQASLRAVVSSTHEPGRDRGAAGLMHPALLLEIQRRQPAGYPPVQQPEVFRATQAHVTRTEEGYPVPLPLEPPGAPALGLVDKPGHADHGGGENRLPQSFIVEGDVASHHRDLKGPARCRDARYGLLELPEDFWTLGRSKIETVRQSQGLGAGDGKVPSRLGHGHGGAGARGKID